MCYFQSYFTTEHMIDALNASLKEVTFVFDIPEELKRLPQRPGVYLMKDEREQIIYVGKAINLRNRVRQYFQPSGQHLQKLRNMVPRIRSFEYIVTDNELEALILESNLIKQYKPKYNVLLKDDKAYPYIKITMNEPFPRMFAVRQHIKDKARYMGPYSSMFAVKETLELIHKLWPLRTCSRAIPREGGKDRPCLNYHIGQCKAPCNGHISYEDYHVIVAQATAFLSGKYKDVVKDLERKMQEASEDMAFEQAAEYRDKISAIYMLMERQKLDSISDGDQDVLAMAKAHDDALIQIFCIRNGKMTGREHFMLSGVDAMSRGQVLSIFITQYYNGTPFIPKELILETDMEDRDVIAEWLSHQKGQKVILTVPQKGEKLHLVELAGKNALITFEQFGENIRREQKKTLGAVAEIQEALGIGGPIRRMEAYDISNIQGYESVASMVVFEQGKPKRNDYRKFKIKSVIGPDDYASMKEVLTRRFNRYIQEQQDQPEGNLPAKNKFSALPDLLLIDGGKGQVSAAEEVLRQFGLSIPVCGMIKDDRHNTRGMIFEGREILPPYTSEGFKLLTRIQDEVHRFAITYHRKLRAKAQVHSILDDIKGIGGTRRRALIKHFGSIEAIRAADMDTLRQAPSMDSRAAKAVYDFFQKL